MPDFDTKPYDTDANCYGYATNVAGCGAATPGGQLPGGDDYFVRLMAGVIADGTKEGVAHLWERSRSLNEIPVLAPGRYLMLMLAGTDGFHFLRREVSRALGRRRWFWKNGTGEALSYWSVDKATRGYTTLSNKNLKKAIQNPKLYVWSKSFGARPRWVLALPFTHIR